MLAICIPVTSWGDYEAYALPGVERLVAAAPDTLVLAETSTGSYQATVNAMLDRLARVPSVDAAVVIHQDVEMLDTSASLLATQFRNDQIAIIGAIGSTARAGLRWWMGAPRGLRIELPEPFPAMVLSGGSAIVAAVDGVMLAFSPWAVQNLRFDERFADNFHGYDIDICLQAQAHNKLVAVEDLPLRHYQVDGLRGGRDTTWIAAEIDIRKKWDLAGSPPGLAWTRGPAA
ncbi:MAG: glycosyltransferase [Solirubrobacteraceae bacterium]|nr:glycosyltransferase [Solirubrobacteraceae bacterium]